MTSPLHDLTIGERVRKRREELGLTQAALADRMGCYQPDVSRLESGQQTPRVDTMQRVADALDIPTTYFFS